MRAGVFNPVPMSAASPVRLVPGGPTTQSRFYDFLSWALPGDDWHTAAIRIRYGFLPSMGDLVRRAVTTWFLIVCRFFLPEQ